MNDIDRIYVYENWRNDFPTQIGIKKAPDTYRYRFFVGSV